MGTTVAADTVPHYELRAPMEIGPRLIPSVRVGDGRVSVEAQGVEPSGRVHWRYFIDCPLGSYESGDSGVTNVPIAGDDWTRMAARALATVCSTLGVEDEPCEWLSPPLDAWRRVHVCDLIAAEEDLGGE